MDSRRQPSSGGRFGPRMSVTAVSRPTERVEIEELPDPNFDEALSFVQSQSAQKVGVEVVKKIEKPRGRTSGCFRNILIVLLAILIPPTTGLSIASLDYIFGLNPLVSAGVLGAASLVLLFDKGNLFDEVLAGVILVPIGVIVGGLVFDTSWITVAAAIALAAMLVAVVAWLLSKIRQMLKWFTSRDNKKNVKLLVFGSLFILLACGLLIVLYLMLSGGSPNLTVGETVTPSATLGATIVVAPPPVVVSTENEDQEGGDEVVIEATPSQEEQWPQWYTVNLEVGVVKIKVFAEPNAESAVLARIKDNTRVLVVEPDTDEDGFVQISQIGETPFYGYIVGSRIEK